MPIATIKYNLSDHDDNMSHLRAIKSLDISLALWEIIYNVRKEIQWDIEQNKYENKEDILDAIFHKILEICNEHNINIDELIE